MAISFWITLTFMTLGAIAILMLPVRNRARVKQERIRLPYLVTAILVPALAMGFYAYLGSPQAAVAGTQGTAATTQPAGSAGRSSRDKQLASVANLVDGLAGRLQREPNDAGGWLLLAKSYRHLGRVEDAAAAYEKARSLGRSDADLESYVASRKSSDPIWTISPDFVDLELGN